MAFYRTSDWLLVGFALLAVVQLVGCQAQPGPPTDTEFQKAVIEQQGPVLVKFGATWCGPCRMLDPQLDRLEADMKGRLEVVHIDVDEQPQLASHYDVSSIPRMLLFQNGEIVGDRLGLMNSEDLAKWIEPHLP